ncbi:bacteriocin-like protein [Chryseobacterium sp. SNU WT5]
MRNLKKLTRGDLKKVKGAGDMMAVVYAFLVMAL